MAAGECVGELQADAELADLNLEGRELAAHRKRKRTSSPESTCGVAWRKTSLEPLLGNS
jgi:hypothetical protein